MKITIAGRGKVGKALFRSFRQAGFEVALISTRELLSANTHVESDMLLLALPDNVLQTIDLKGKVLSRTAVIHCAGTLPSDIFNKFTDRYGVFYPSRSFTGTEEETLQDAHIFVTANHPDTLQQLKDLAVKSGAHVLELTDTQRLQLHIAAVFAHNFTNHMIFIAKKISAEASVPFSVILDLLKPYFDNLFSGSHPEDLQTGPAARDDTSTIEKHIRLLESHKDWQNIYRFVTQSIRNTVKKHEDNEKF